MFFAGGSDKASYCAQRCLNLDIHRKDSLSEKSTDNCVVPPFVSTICSLFEKEEERGLGDFTIA